MLAVAGSTLTFYLTPGMAAAAVAIVIGKCLFLALLLLLTAGVPATVDVAVAQMVSWNAAVVLLLLDSLFLAI